MKEIENAVPYILCGIVVMAMYGVLPEWAGKALMVLIGIGIVYYWTLVLIKHYVDNSKRS